MLGRGIMEGMLCSRVSHQRPSGVHFVHLLRDPRCETAILIVLFVCFVLFFILTITHSEAHAGLQFVVQLRVAWNSQSCQPGSRSEFEVCQGNMRTYLKIAK